MRKMRWGWAGFLLVALLTQGCSAASTPANSTASVNGQSLIQEKAIGRPEGHECTQGKEEWRSPGAPKRGGQLEFGNVNVDEHLDPTLPGRVAQLVVPQFVYQGLLEYQGCFYGDSAVVPRLGDSWAISSDYLTYTVK